MSIDFEPQIDFTPVKQTSSTPEPPKEETPKFYEIEKQPGIPKTVMGQAKMIGKEMLYGLASPMPGSLIQTPLRIVRDVGQRTGADVARGVDAETGSKVLARMAGFGTSTVLDPLTYFGGGLLKGPEAVVSKPLSEMEPGVEAMLNNLKEQNAPLKGQIEQATAKVMDSLENTVKKYGDELNQAKKNIGIPTTNAERELAISEHGNPHGLSEKNLNPLYKDIITPTNSALDLVKKISKFKSVAGDITDDSMKVKTASVLQDNINNIVDWSKPGDTAEGVLKSQYKDLQQLAIPESLKASKAKMSEVLNLSNDLSSKLEEPGKAESFLRSIVTGKSARNKDYLMSIRHLETLSGEPLFDKIAKAVQTEKATEAAIKQFEKLKPIEKKTMEDSGVNMADILSHRITGWTSVVKDILNAKDSIKGPAKNIARTIGNQSLLGLSRGFSLSDTNKQKLNDVMNKLRK